LNDNNERKKLRDAFADQLAEGTVHLEFVKPTYEDLSKALRDVAYHVFHFIGHGSFDPATSQGCLYFANKQPVDGKHLGALLQQEHSGVRLAILNACDGAQTADQGLFSGVAGHLLEQGVPAVIAMQAEISDSVAIKFTDIFYEELAHGSSIGRSMYEVRNSLLNQGSLEWGLPVLFMRGESQLLVRSSRPNPASCRPPDPVAWPMIGQTQTLAGLSKTLLESLQGEPRAVVITGAPGSGKTRLTNELVPIVNPSEQDFILVRPETATEPNKPLNWIMATVKALYPGATLQQTLELLDQNMRQVLERVFFPNPETAKESHPPKDEGFNQLKGLKWLLGGARKPLLMVLENLEQIDLASLEVIHSLWQQRRRRGLALIVTCNADIEMDPDRMVYIQDWIQNQFGAKIKLQPLNQSEIEQLADAITRASNENWKKTWTLQQLIDLTGGDPRALIERLTGSSPGDLESWYMSRIERITDPNALEMLSICAVQGEPETSVELLEQIFGSVAMDRARRLLERNEFILVTSKPDGSVRFRSPYMAQMVQQRLEAGKIAELKRRIAMTMTMFNTVDPTRIASLFRESRIYKNDFPRSESNTECHAYLQCATAFDLRGEGFEKSIAWIDLALRLIDQSEATLHIQLLIEKARILERHGKLWNALDILAATDALLEFSNDLLIRNQARIATANILVLKTDQITEAQSLARDVLIEAKANTNIRQRDQTLELLSGAFNILGNVAMRKEKFELAKGFFEKSLGQRNLTNSRFLTASLNNLGRALRKLNKHQEAERRLKESLELRTTTGDKIGQARAQMNLGLLYLDSNRLQEAIGIFTDSNRVIQQINDPWVQATRALNLGVALFKSNQFQAAGEQYQNALTISSEASNQLTQLEPEARYNLAEVLFLTGQNAAALEQVRALNASTPATTQIETQRQAEYHLLAAEVLLSGAQAPGKAIAEAVIAFTKTSSAPPRLHAWALLAGYAQDTTALAALQSNRGQETHAIFDWANAVAQRDVNALGTLLESCAEPIDRYRIFNSLCTLDQVNAAHWQKQLEEFQQRQTSPTDMPITSS
jgi:tetratricopeptide (TPR) repeat protein